MSKIKIVQSSWTMGQSSPKLGARSDTDMLAKTAQTIENFTVIQQGGLTKRFGTIYKLNNAVFTSTPSRIIPIKCSSGNLLIIFTVTLGLIYCYNVDTDQIFSNTSAFFNGSVISEIKYSQLDNQILFTHKNMRPVKVTISSGGSLTLIQYPITSPPANDFTQDYDSYWFNLIKGAGTGNVFKIGDEVLIEVYPTQALANTHNDNTPAGGGRNAETRYVNGIFVGRGCTFRILSIAVQSGKISKYKCELLDNDLITQLGDNTVISGKSVFLAEPVFGGARGYPACSTFYQDRLWFGGTKDIPNGLWASAISNYNRWESGTALDSDPLSFKLSCDATPKIIHIVSSKNIVILTDVGEFAFLSVSNSGTISASNINISLQTKNGTTDCQPQELDNQLFYVQFGGNVIRATDYTYTTNSYQSVNASIICPELINSPISSGIIKNINNDDNSYLIYVNIDGSIACLQSVSSQNIVAWTKWTSKDRSFVSVSSVNGRAFCLVKNNINNLVSLEEFSLTSYVDAKFTSPIVNGIISGVSTGLEGLTFSIKLPTGKLYTAVSSGGTININDSTVNASGEIGVLINSIMTTTPYTLRNPQFGDLLMTPKKISNVYLYYYLSIGLVITVNSNDNIVPNLIFDESSYNQQLIPTTDVYKSDVTINWNLLENIAITQNAPYPATILAIGATLNI
jgi:hypothetical protein